MTTLKTSHSALYRAIQFFVALKATLPTWAGGGLSLADQALAAAILTTPAQRQLFKQMFPNDQRHAVAVVRTLQQAGYSQPALVQAALLHDAAKSLGQPIIHRVLIVLLNRFWPSGLVRLSQISDEPMANLQGAFGCGEWPELVSHSPFAHSPIPKWRRPFVVHAHHPVIGAAWATQSGCQPLAVRLIARHQELLENQPANEEEQLLALLQWADNLN
jgi:hypothetical protein